VHAISGLVLCSGICFALWIPNVDGQVYLVLDTTRIPLIISYSGVMGSRGISTLKRSLEYSFSASLFSYVNGSGQEGKGQVLLLNGFKYSWTIGHDEDIYCTNTFSHRLGVRYFFDSVTRIHADENIFRTRLEYKIARWSGLAFDSELSTRLLNGYDYLLKDSNQVVRVLNSSFLTPLIWNLSLGLSFRVPGTGTVLLGISGARLTVIRDTSVFSAQQSDVYQGIRRGSNHLFEYGLSCRIQAERTFWKILRWNCDMLVFKGFNKPADLNLKNLFEIRPVNFLVISLQSRICYEEDISRRIVMENILSAGFSFKK
jgi:hypothetical protein